MGIGLEEIPTGSVSTANPEPLHAQLTAVLRGCIEGGSWPPGTVLPTEAEFQQRFHVSRSVVRQALAGLTTDGLIQRGRGRASVVAPRRELHRLVQRMAGLSTQFEDRGVHVATRILSLRRARDAHAEAELGTTHILGIRRLRSAGGEPLALIHTWLPLRQVPDLDADELTDASLHGVLRHKYGISIISGTRQVRALAASEEIAPMLAVAPGTPVLLLEGTSRDERGRPIEVFSTWHRADRVVFDIDVVRDGQGATPANAEGSTGLLGTPTDGGAPLVPVATVAAAGTSADDAPTGAPPDVARTARQLARELRDASRRLEDLAALAGAQTPHPGPGASAPPTSRGSDDSCDTARSD